MVGNGMSMAMLTLGRCAMLRPHYHPRVSTYAMAMDGETETYMIPETGGRLVWVTLAPGKMTLFPMGSLHAMQNKGSFGASVVSVYSELARGEAVVTRRGSRRETRKMLYPSELASTEYVQPLRGLGFYCVVGGVSYVRTQHLYQGRRIC